MNTNDRRAPLIIEVAINGARTPADHPHVPVTPRQMADCVDACVDAGASIVHAHAGEAVVGSGGQHASAAYIQAFGAMRERHPALLLYPTLPGGAPGLTMATRLAHVRALHEAGLLGLVPVDPGTMNYGRIDGHGHAPTHDAVYQTTYADVAWAFDWCRAESLACTMSAFEPGFVRLAEAHRRAGTLPRAAIVKLEFSAGARLFGLQPDAAGLDAWLALFDSRRLAWMVTLRDGDPATGLAQLAIARGGHVRVGIEDHGGDHASPRNEDLVAAIARMARDAGRCLARPDDVRALITTTN